VGRVATKLRGWWRLVTGLWRRRAMEDRLADEIRFHLDMHAARSVGRGMEEPEAYRTARLAFGARQQFAEEARDEYRSRPVAELGRDLRYAVRSLRRAPSFAAASILTLALGIGGTTVIFSLVDHVVLRPLDYRDPGRLVVVREIIEEMTSTYPSFPANAGHFVEWRRRSRTFADLAALRQRDVTLTGDGDPERLTAVRTSPSLFRVLGAQLALGRVFTDDEDHPGRDGVVVVSHGFWRRRLGGHPAAVGRTITLDDSPVVVVGVLAPSFRLPKGNGLGGLLVLPPETDVYKPLALQPWEVESVGEYSYAVIARLAPGATTASAHAELAVIEKELGERARSRITLRPRIVPLEAQVLGTARRPLMFLLAAVAMVLIIVCVNLANLATARNAARLRESAVRLALGAARGRLVRHGVTETVVLASIGGGLGIALAYWSVAALVALAPSSLPRVEEIRLDARVLLVAIAVSLATGLAFGIVPALRLAATDPGETLKAGGRSVSETRQARRSRNLFITAQVGLTTVLLIATGLFLNSFVRVLRVDKGFVPDRVLAVDVVLSAAKYPSNTLREQFYQQVRQRLLVTAGVERAAITSWPPLEGETQVDGLSLEGETRPESEQPLANIRYVSADYFATIGTPLVRGRAMTDLDRGRSVAVVSQRVGRILWPNEDPIGKRLIPGSNDSVAEVIGIAADVRSSSLELDGAPVVYLPFRGGPAAIANTILVRTASDPVAMLAAVRAAIREVDSNVPATKVRTLEQVVSAVVAQRRFQLALLVLFGLIALTTASVGVFGVISNSLTRRIREMGVRIAFGAKQIDVHRLVLKEGLTPSALGLAFGIAAALLLGRSFRVMLFEVGPTDPVTLAAVVLVIGVVAVLACYLPARRVAKLDPAAVMRAE